MNRRLPWSFAVSVGLVACLTWCVSTASAEEPVLLELSGDLGTHDPVMAKDGDTYYIYFTGGRGPGGRGGGGGRGGRRGRRGGANADAENAAGEAAAAQPTPAEPTPVLPAAGEAAAAQPATTQPPAGDAADAQPAEGQRGQRGGGATGMVSMLTSPDMKNWTSAGFALKEMPAWVAEEVPRARNTWAPDISFFNGKWHLYYSVSSFGSQNSAIGLATNTTLNPNSPDYNWVDQGMVIRSNEDVDDFNAIDPNIVIEDENNVWMSWGSFWGGMMMRRIDPATGKLSETDTTLHKLARRERGTAIEAPFIIRHGDHWYLFVSWDRCCQGPRSTYKVAVGRSETITGPYLDKEGKDMAAGGGTLILDPQTDNWHGAGHNGYFRENGNDFLVFHSYRAMAGRGGPGSQLFISTVAWEDGWPRVAVMP